MEGSHTWPCWCPRAFSFSLLSVPLHPPSLIPDTLEQIWNCFRATLVLPFVRVVEQLYKSYPVCNFIVVIFLGMDIANAALPLFLRSPYCLNSNCYIMAHVLKHIPRTFSLANRLDLTLSAGTPISLFSAVKIKQVLLFSAFFPFSSSLELCVRNFSIVACSLQPHTVSGKRYSDVVSTLPLLVITLHSSNCYLARGYFC